MSVTAPIGMSKKIRPSISIGNSSGSDTRQEPSPNPAKKRQIFFVHVGKTGGETIRGIFKSACKYRLNRQRRGNCYRFFENHNKTGLSLQTFGFIHCKDVAPQNGPKEATTFLWSIRNPMDRISSWFDYSNPANYPTRGEKISGWAYDFYRLCYKDADAFARSLGKQQTLDHVPVNSTTGESCSQLSWGGVNGKASFHAGHLHYDYRFYADPTTNRFPGKEVMAVRTEYMWDDLQNIEHMLNGGVINKEEYATVDHGSGSFTKKSKLSPREQKYFAAHSKTKLRSMSMY